MKPLFYKFIVLFLFFTGFAFGQKHVVYNKVYKADKNTVININIDQIFISIEESSDGKIHFDYNLEFENYSKKEIEKILAQINVKTEQSENIINLIASSDNENKGVSYSFESDDIMIVDINPFGSKEEKSQEYQKSKDSILKEIRYHDKSSLEKMLKHFRFEDQNGKSEKINTKNVKVKKNNFVLKIPSFVKMNIKAKKSDIYLNYNYLTKIDIDLNGGKFKSKRLDNVHNQIQIKDATFLSESLSAEKLILNNTSKCIIGEIKNINIESEVSKIEIGEVQKNVVINDFNSEYFLYNFTPNFYKTSFTGQYSKVHFHESLLGYTLKVFGYNTVFHFGDMEGKIGPTKNATKNLMLKIKRRPEKKSSGNLDFDIVHGIMYINLLPDQE